jgi:hypothetical protein
VHTEIEGHLREKLSHEVRLSDPIFGERDVGREYGLPVRAPVTHLAMSQQVHSLAAARTWEARLRHLGIFCAAGIRYEVDFDQTRCSRWRQARLCENSPRFATAARKRKVLIRMRKYRPEDDGSLSMTRRAGLAARIALACGIRPVRAAGVLDIGLVPRRIRGSWSTTTRP